MRGFSILALMGALAAFGLGETAAPAVANPLGVDFASPPSDSSGNCAGPSLFCYGYGGTLGYEFTVGNSAVSVGGLAVFDDGSLSLVNGATVGLWYESSPNVFTLETSVIVSSLTATAGGAGGLWAVEAITPLELAANSVWIVGAEGPGGYLATYAGDIPITTDSEIKFDEDQSITSSTLSFPSQSNGSKVASASFFGGNIEINPVPEPMSLSLFGAALAGFGLLRRRKKA